MPAKKASAKKAEKVEVNSKDIMDMVIVDDILLSSVINGYHEWIMELESIIDSSLLLPQKPVTVLRQVESKTNDVKKWTGTRDFQAPASTADFVALHGTKGLLYHALANIDVRVRSSKGTQADYDRICSGGTSGSLSKAKLTSLMQDAVQKGNFEEAKKYSDMLAEK